MNVCPKQNIIKGFLLKDDTDANKNQSINKKNCYLNFKLVDLVSASLTKELVDETASGLVPASGSETFN